MQVSSRFMNWAFVLCLSGAGVALATETRLGVLRYNGGVSDETLVFRYPGMISKYKIALIELGTSSDTQAYGAAFADAGGFSIGAALSRTDWMFTSGMITHNVNGSRSSALSLFDAYETAMMSGATPALYAPTRPIEFLAGFNIGAGTLGLRLSIADYKNKTSTNVNNVSTSNDYTAQQAELAIGFHTDAAGSMDLALTMSPTANQKRGETANGTDSSTSVKGSSTAIDGRWLSSENESSPYVKAKLATRSMKATGRSGGRDFSSKFSDQVTSVEGGYVGLASANNAKLFVGAELMLTSSKGPSITGTGATAVPSYTANDESVKIDANVVSGTLSGEVDAAWGFGLMAGMHYVMLGDIVTKDNTTNQNIKKSISFPETSDSTLWSLGLNYKAGALRLDAEYKKEYLHKGPHFLAGNTTAPLLTKISASYAF
ncbi:MAG: hypothetical protein NT027_10010 [Proteobacteria bacterium]|nr:hypothetical protein [Pseudomonadota bacterium]